MKVALFSSQKYEKPFFNDAVSAYPNLDIAHFEHALSMETVSLASGYDAICVFVNDDVNACVLAELAELGVKFVALRCAGYNNVDIEAAHALGIQVVRVPAYSPEAVAEHCIALMLTLARKTHKAYNRVREENFDLNGLLGFNIHNKTVGIIGCGKIGQSLVSILNGFGAHTLVFDPNIGEGSYTKVSLQMLFEQSDIISLHCPLTDATHHLLNDEAFDIMKPGVMVINTSRGALIDTQACIKALKSKKIGYLGLDVYEQESELFFKDRSEDIIQDDDFIRLSGFPNVLITGHQGFFTKEALVEIASTTVENLNMLDCGEESPNSV
ncbi:D-lactate dehydrogenase [Pseudoalteromonas luteoviolacea CPMOR-2]|uniref:D-lactate dehydrogenase n=1 Tax=Pseudoalteromonas luteoviolacea DSM 6061 TaxID=1365250 RepID=A0A166VPK9_9GAMM|nr:2-hydroxyacid dehydrogenase [Pseudoalteromonas luteoviolacea]KZN33248.1 D-lactate dehydrogenase [Pseudoalteromonas luteoviolacea DSM 6061]KZN57143.1 D-lactate dehydrogenase [Pseudoalteromonas luteoviolacea CPMOR-2]MBE0385957.1 D-lactate dehydrogenase [Pseudoalteromonas luteoviolacea DSM 6061]